MSAIDRNIHSNTHHNCPTDMSRDDFVLYGARILEDIAQYMAHPEAVSVFPSITPGSIKTQLPLEPPQFPVSMDEILSDFHSILMPGMTHWNHPGFMAYFANSSPGPSILAETLIAGLNQNAMLWRTSPSATELEEVTTRWVAKLIGLPDTMSGLITDTASMSTLLAIAAAREQIPGLNIREEGLSSRPEVPTLRIYTSDQAHSATDKAAITLGIGHKNVRKIKSDGKFRMDVAQLQSAVMEDRANGYLPFCVVATVGTTSTTSIDPVGEISDVCTEERMWLHVDAAYAGSAAVAPEFRYVLDGCDRVDSLVLNPHKWLFTTMDCSLLFVKSPEALRRAFSLVPEFLVTDTDDVATNYMDWGVQLGRRFRALKLWFVIRYFGQEGLAALIREHVRLGADLAHWVDSTPYFERTAPTPLSTVCFRAVPTGSADRPAEWLDQFNMAVMDYVNQSGEIFLSHTKLHGSVSLRCAIGNLRTGQANVDRLKSLLIEGAGHVINNHKPA